MVYIPQLKRWLHFCILHRVGQVVETELHERVRSACTYLWLVFTKSELEKTFPPDLYSVPVPNTLCVMRCIFDLNWITIPNILWQPNAAGLKWEELFATYGRSVHTMPLNIGPGANDYYDFRLLHGDYKIRTRDSTGKVTREWDLSIVKGKGDMTQTLWL